MININVVPDCGNSLKKLFQKEINITFAEGNTAFILNHVRDDILWNVVGDKDIQGMKDFAEALEEMKNNETEELTITHVMTHGKEGAVNGTMKLKDG